MNEDDNPLKKLWNNKYDVKWDEKEKPRPLDIKKILKEPLKDKEVEIIEHGEVDSIMGTYFHSLHIYKAVNWLKDKLSEYVTLENSINPTVFYMDIKHDELEAIINKAIEDVCKD